MESIEHSRLEFEYAASSQSISAYKMYRVCINERNAIIGRIAACIVCPIEIVVNLLLKSIVRISDLGEVFRPLKKGEIKDSVKELQKYCNKILRIVPDVCFAPFQCLYQIGAAFYNPKRVLPFLDHNTYQDDATFHLYRVERERNSAKRYNETVYSAPRDCETTE